MHVKTLILVEVIVVIFFIIDNSWQQEALLRTHWLLYLLVTKDLALNLSVVTKNSIAILGIIVKLFKLEVV